MSLRLVTLAERPDLAAEMDRIREGAWPEYNLHGEVKEWVRLPTEFPEFQFLLVEESTGGGVGIGFTVPLPLAGSLDDLPEGIDEALVRGMKRARPATALCALMAIVDGTRRGEAISGEIVRAMGAVASRHGLAPLVAPVRPNRKHLYPLVPIERYATWVREDGLPFDPWLRVHARVGGLMVRPAPRSMRISGTVGQWEKWTGMAFPESGEYVFPEGLAPVAIDRERDTGVYYEPNIWVRHEVGPTT